MTEYLKHLVTLLAGFLVISIILANPILLIMSLVILLYITIGSNIPNPQSITIKKESIPEEIKKDQKFKKDLKIRTSKGTGLIIIKENLSKYLELIKGSNAEVIPINDEEDEKTLSFTIKCSKRGIHKIGPRKIIKKHILDLKKPDVKKLAENKIKVKPKIRNFNKIRSKKTSTEIFRPSGSTSKIGTPKMEFKDLRKYQRGDPFKIINWKATAKRSTIGKTTLIVNEKEKEGKEEIWIYLDLAKNIIIGNDRENTLEYSIEAAGSIAKFFINRKKTVGFCTYSSTHYSNKNPFNKKQKETGKKIIRPRTGQKQYLKILNELTEINPRKQKNLRSLNSTIHRIKNLKLSNQPFNIIITRISENNVNNIERGIRELIKISQGQKNTKNSIMIINLQLTNFGEEKNDILVEELTKTKNEIFSQKIRKKTHFVDWNPKKDSWSKIHKGIA